MSIYLDHNATSPMHPEVVEAILPFLHQPSANPSSLHSAGRMARSAIESARAEVASLLCCSSGAVIFTSSGTEANNLLLKGCIDKSSNKPLVTSQIEHASVMQPVEQLANEGCSAIHLPCGANGQIDLTQAALILSDCQPQILSVILANNETGVIQPVKQLTAMVDRKQCITHSDATQVVGKLPLDMNDLGLDAISFSGHKIRGPQGIGVLILKDKAINPLISGGDHEKGRRAGTENVAMIVGLGKAAQIAAEQLDQKKQYLSQLTEMFETRVKEIPGVVIFGEESTRLPNTSYFAIPYYHGETLLMELDHAGFALSSGSACHSEVTAASHVLKAMGVDDSLALNAVRVSFGMTNTCEDIDSLIAKLHQMINKLPAVMRQAV